MSDKVPYQEIAQDIGSASVGELAGTFHYHKQHKAQVYAILAIHPALSDTQRDLVIRQRGDHIISHIDSIDTTSIHVVTEKHTFTPQDFQQYKQQIQKALTGEPFVNQVYMDASDQNTVLLPSDSL